MPVNARNADGDVSSVPLASELVRLFIAVTVAAEVSDVRRATISVNDVNGNPVATVRRLKISVHKPDMTLDATAFTAKAVSGSGTLRSTDAKAVILLDTAADGTVQTDITDVAGASGLTAKLTVELHTSATAGDAFVSTPRDVDVAFN